ncbi:alpha/beta-hydrolase [Mycena floridula]|nr:alpha/beta-hydrolase [Mycena floridula]
MVQKAPYGTWKTPITAESITASSVKINDVVVDSIHSRLYHLEGRPSEGGRVVVVDTLDEKDMVSKDANVRTGVHEYGGAAAIVRDSTIFYSNIVDNRVYRRDLTGKCEPVTPDNKAHRFANFDMHPTHTRFLVSILEDHTVDTPDTVINTLCIINPETKTVHPLVSGADFYASPKFSPDGSHIAYQQWYHPDMSWEGAEIHIADVVVGSDSITITNDIHVAGKKLDISASFPSWASNTTLIFTSDESGYQNPWKYIINAKASPIFPEPVAEDFSISAWILDWWPYAIIDSDGNYGLFTSKKDGRNVLYLVDIGTGERTLIDSPYVSIENVRALSTSRHEIVFSGAKVDEGTTIVKCAVSLTDSPPTFSFTTLKSSKSHIPVENISVPQPITLEREKPLYALYHPPHNPEYEGMEGEKPPCAVYAHGGPTSFTGQELDSKVQYFTSRGWAWLSVNYGGSYGYGRAYISSLNGKWGIIDVEDCIAAARAVSHPPYNLIDPARMVIRGGSAGGFTVLASMSNSSDPGFFAAGTASYGISDLALLDADTHKFESHGLVKLIGVTLKEHPEVYKERSPISHADKIVSPLLLLHGENDRVVPKEQAELIYETVKARGGVIDFKLYEGEGHGWRQEKTLVDSLEREIGFYEKILKLQ